MAHALLAQSFATGLLVCSFAASPALAALPDRTAFGTTANVGTKAGKTGPSPLLYASLSAPSSQSVTAISDILNALKKGQSDAAIRRARGLTHAPTRKLAYWLISISGRKGISAQFIARAAQDLDKWPSSRLIRIRAEQALLADKPNNATILQAFKPEAPVSFAGKLAYAKALLAAGQTKKARQIVRTLWRTAKMNRSRDKAILTSPLARLLTAQDHKRRMDLLLYAERAKQAGIIANKLGAASRQLAQARTAVIRKDKKAAKLLKALPSSVHKDPLYALTMSQHLRRAGNARAAAAHLAKASTNPAHLVNLKEWWTERRVLSRKLLLERQFKQAYRLVAAYRGGSSAAQVSAQFHAGWYALRFLQQPKLAQKHFTALLKQATARKSRARGYFWLGRAYKAQKNYPAASKAFQQAGRFSTTYYGQLALSELGAKSLSLSQLPKPNSADTSSVFQTEVGHGIRVLLRAKAHSKADVLYRHLARRLKDPGSLVALAAHAERNDRHQASLQVGAIAHSRGYTGLARLAFPLKGIPRGAKISRIERPLVYAIARQESRFDRFARSRANARGVMQLLPGTAKLTAKKLGIPYRANALYDAAYNAQLGSGYFGNLVERFNGSYVLAIAGYNAGPGNARKWIKTYGDPRSGAFDPVDWVELVPFTETRNYIQHVMENLQVYRTRLADKNLAIRKDLARGQP